MPRNVSLTALIAAVRSEAGHSTSVAAGVDSEAAIIQKIQRNQQMLYDDYDWSFLRETWKLQLQATQRYYDIPPNILSDASVSVLEIERIESVAINYSGKPLPLDRGINWEQYAQYNSDNGEMASPCRRWDVKRTSANTEQIEAWPVPDDNTQVMQFKGIRKLRPLVAPSDVCDLDDILIVLTTAAEILARAKHADAGKVEAKASRRLDQLEARTRGPSIPMNMASSGGAYARNRGKTIIRIGSQTN